MLTPRELQATMHADMARWVPEVLRQTAQRLESSALRNAVAGDREQSGSVLGVLQGRPGALFQAWIAAMSALSDDMAPTPRSPATLGKPIVMSMVDEDQIDEDIEVARIVQGVEAEAEWELRELAALCSKLQGRDDISADANPLHPGLLGRALRRALDPFDLPKAARLLLLRQIGPVLGQRVKKVYADHAERLLQQGVTPARFRVRQAARDAQGQTEVDRQNAAGGTAGAGSTPGATSASAAPSAGTLSRKASAGAGTASPARASPARAGQLARLVQWALNSAPTPESLETEQADAPLRLLTELLPMDAASTPIPSLGSATAVSVMERLLEVLERQASISEAMRALMRRLDRPARELAAHDPDLWRSLDHPWWQLLDRMISAGSVQDEIEIRRPGVTTTSLARVVSQLEGTAKPNAAMLRGALADVDAVVTGLMEERSEQVEPEAASMQTRADAEDAEVHLRQQMVEQLRLTPAPALLRQFLLGPWVISMARVAVTDGTSCPAFTRLTAMVDALIATCTRPPTQPLTPFRLDDLLERTRTGLAYASLGTNRVERELADLRAVLTHPTAPGIPSPGEYTEELPVAPVIGGHAALPTVPIDMIDGVEGNTRASEDRRTWIESLEPGDYCRVFLQARWVTAQLTWRSSNRNMFIFTSRLGGGAHSLTRRALERLRNAGLAATIEHGDLIAHAMDTIIEDDDTSA